jgi:hypothetical protein
MIGVSDNSKKEETVKDASQVVSGYLAAFNETDQVRRLSLVEQLYTSDCVYTDPHVEVTGRMGVCEFIAQTQERFPGYRFALSGDVDAHHDQARFQWQAGPAEDPGRYVGFDVIVCEDDRIERVLGFMDAAPAA